MIIFVGCRFGPLKSLERAPDQICCIQNGNKNNHCICTLAALVTVLKQFLKLFSYAETETLSFAGSIDNTDNLRYVF
jgi:hypothetical protein